MALLLAVCVLAGALVAATMPKTLAGVLQTVPGNYTLVGGCDNGFNRYHMEGTDGVGNPIYYPTFCTHRNYTSAPGTYTYYRNTDPDESTGNPTLLAMLNNAYLSVAQYRNLRYMIAYTNINKFVNGQFIYWAWLAHTNAAQYSAIGNSATNQGFPWSDAYNTYFGSVAGTLGGGAVAAGQGLSIGNQCYTGIGYNGTDITAAATSASPPLHPAAVTTGSYRVGPYKIDWNTAGLSRPLAQLNYGPNRNEAPLFSLSTANAADGSRVRFYLAGATTPTTTVAIGQTFYVDYVPTDANLEAAAGGIEIPIVATSQKTLVTKILADRFFAHPNAQNQINIETETQKPVYRFNVRYRSPWTPPPQAEWVRPTVDKTVAESNQVNANGIYQDVLRLPAGGNTIHKVTVSATEPKSTELIFQAADYDLLPENNSLPTYEEKYVALVTTAAQLKDALVNNYNIKLMSNVALPASWTAPSNAYTKILDGNGYALTAGTMTDSLLHQTGTGAVIYRLKFTGFNMTQTRTAAFEDRYTGALINNASSTKLINVYLDGTLTANDPIAGPNTTVRWVGGVIGGIAGDYECYGVQAKMKITHNFTTFTADYANASQGYGFSTGGLIGYVATYNSATPPIAACDLLPGSEINSAAGRIGGLFGLVDTGRLIVEDCSAAVAVTPQRAGAVFGGIISNVNVPTTLRRCKAQGTVNNSSAKRLLSFGGLAGTLIAGSDTFTAENCFADFSGLTVYTRAGAGLIAVAPGQTFSLNNSPAMIVRMSEARVRLETTGEAAGIVATNYFSGVGISDCLVSGQITGSAAGLFYGYNGSGSVSLVRNVVNMTLNGSQVLGLAGMEHCNVTARYNFFRGTITASSQGTSGVYWDAGGSGQFSTEISNNYFDGTINTNTFGTPATAYTLNSAATATTLFGTNMGLSIGTGTATTWKYATATPWVPTLNNTGPNPRQRIYVHDYYNGATSPVSLNDLFVYEGGAFRTIWNSNYAVAGSGSGGTTILMDYPAHQTFSFYYRVNALDEGVYHNDVKLMPLKSPVIGSASPYQFDWGGTKDDDWVISYQNRYYLNLRKLTNIANYPITLNGTSFRLWYSPTIYSDLTDVTYTGWLSETLNNVNGDFGKTFAMQLKPGSYVLKEISAPEYYDIPENLERTWYGLFQNGQFMLYENDPTFSFPAKKMNLGETYTSDGYTLTYTAQIMNSPDPTKPYARIVIDKRNEDGSQPILGQEVTDPATYIPRWTGAIYQVEKFDTTVSTETFQAAGFSGMAYGYGNMIRCNENPLNYCEIDYGYYCVTERQAPDGYMVDPTPFYVAFTKDGGGTLRVFDQHMQGVDQVGYLPGVQDLYVQNQITVTAINTTNPIGQTVSTWVANIPARDKKPEYKLDLHKYETSSGAALAGIEFKLYRDSDNALIGTYTTNSMGDLSIVFPPMVDGFYTLKETSGEIADYHFETRGGALLLNGGPHNYNNIKIIRGGLDTHCYVIVDADGYAWVVEPGDPQYPADLETVTETQLGVVHAAISVPNVRYRITEYFHPDEAPFLDLKPPVVTMLMPGASFTGHPPATIPSGAGHPWTYIGYREGDDDSAPLIPGDPPAPLVPSADDNYDFIYVYAREPDEVSFTIRKTLNLAAGQTERFVFRIEYLGNGASAGDVERTFYSVLHVQSGQMSDSIDSAAVPMGWYRVTELDSNWRYTLHQAALAGDNPGAAIAARAVTRRITEGSPVFAFRNTRDDVPWVHAETGVINEMPPVSS
jgi:hypothetical protein